MFKKRAAVEAPPVVEESAPVVEAPVAVVDVPSGLLAGFADADLHANIVEAVKVLGKAQDTYAHSVRGIETQYLKALDIAYADQAAAVRALYARREKAERDPDQVRARW